MKAQPQLLHLGKLPYPERFISCILFLILLLQFVSIHYIQQETPAFLLHGRKICVAIGMFSRTDEFSFREWHRQIFLKYSSRHAYASQIKFMLKFSMAMNSNHTIMDFVKKEAAQFDDIVILDMEESEACMKGNRCLLKNGLLMFKSLLGILDSIQEECTHFFVLKIDNDVVVSFDLLAKLIVQDIPKRSVIFGKLIPNTPTHHVEVRLRGSFSQSFFPIWPEGGFQGFSRDVIENILQQSSMNTVMREHISYIFPEEDRGMGLLLHRAGIPVKHWFYVRGVHSFCSSDQFSCDAYGNSIAFNVGFGWSGVGENKLVYKQRMLQRIFTLRNSCSQTKGVSHAYEHSFEIDDKFLSSPAYKWMFDGCLAMNKLGGMWLEEYKNQDRVIRETFDINQRSEQCAEDLYKVVQPEVVNLIADGLFVSAKEYHIKEGYKNASLHYFCPDIILSGSLSIIEFAQSCDKERNYLQSYADAKEAVSEGKFATGWDHFQTHGIREDRSWSCWTRFLDKPEGDRSAAFETVSKFVDVSKPFVNQWPIHGVISETVNSGDCKAVLLVDGRDHPWMDFVLRNHRRYTGEDWLFYIIGPMHMYQKWHARYSGPMVKVVEAPTSFGNFTNYPLEISHLYLSKWLWNEVVQCEYVLVTQSDALLLRPGIEDFFMYDYVGSPIYPELFPKPHWKQLCTKYNRCGGNGGLSFRRRSAMLGALNNCSLPKIGVDEDYWFSACLAQDSLASLPHPVIAGRFNEGTKCLADGSLGVHNFWLHCNEETAKQILSSSKLYDDMFEGYIKCQCGEGESLYLDLYPDILQAKQSGMISSGWAHYKQAGYKENRIWKCLPSSCIQK